MNPCPVETTNTLVDSVARTAGAARRPCRLKAAIPFLVLAAVTLAVHGRGLFDGLFLDDHLHITRYASSEWSLRYLLDATTIVPDEFMDTWWQDRSIRWQYARPFSVLLSKVVYQLSGRSVKALHGLSIGLHLAGAVLVYWLCRLLTRRPGWSLVGGLLFAIHSHSIYAVGWLAAQNSVLQTVLTLAALLCYVRAARMNIYSGADSQGLDAVRTLAEPGRCAVGWFVLAMACWLLALFSRENALVFPVLAALFEVTFGGWRSVRARIGLYALMGLVAAGFALWRLKFYYVPMPDFYVRRYDGPEYLGWWLVKLLHWITGVVWLSPLMIGPSARINPLREVPGDCLLMAVIVGTMAVGYFLACRRARGWWLWPAWILLSLLPVVPVFAGPQSAYMPAVGFAVGMVLGPALRREIRPVAIGRWSPAVAIWFLIATSSYIPVYRSFWLAVQSAERFTIAQMAADPPEPQISDVFLINVPFVNIYAPLHLREELGGSAGSRHARYHVLTYAPNVLRMEEACRLEQVDAHTLRLSIEGRGYFSGALGRYLIESMRPAGRLYTGDRVRGEQFEVEVLRADGEGVKELQFQFHEPLATQRYSFYIGTNRHPAVRVHFWGHEEPPVATRPLDSGQPATFAEVESAGRQLRSGRARAAEPLFRAMAASDIQLRARAQTIFRQVAFSVGEATAAPVADTLALPEWSPRELATIRNWWHASVDDENLEVAWVRREDWRPYEHRRDRLFEIRQIAGRFIRTDLYLTGPSYPGPR